MSPKDELQRLVDCGVYLGAESPAINNGLPVRRSAVLILFGQLDHIDAATHSTNLFASNEPLISANLDVLLLQRAENMSHHPGQIAFPGGGIDPEDFGPEAAALREAQEETGLDPAGVEVLGSLPELLLPVSKNLVTPVIGWWTRPSEVAAIDRAEAASVFRVPVAEMLDPQARGTGVITRGALTHRSHAFELSKRFGNLIIWGFTGNLLGRMFDELGWTLPWDEARQIRIPVDQVSPANPTGQDAPRS